VSKGTCANNHNRTFEHYLSRCDNTPIHKGALVASYTSDGQSTSLDLFQTSETKANSLGTACADLLLDLLGRRGGVDDISYTKNRFPSHA